jgi:carbon-monoxide dehydrogenase large subunit
MLHTAFVRSRVAHARLRAVRIPTALPHGALILTAADLAVAPTLPCAVPHPLAVSRTPPPLAVERVRYVGEPIAAVIAADRATAEDLAEMVEVEYDPLPAVTDPEQAIATGAVRLHGDAPGNILLRVTECVGDAETALTHAARVVRGRFRMARNSAQPLEPRAIVAEPTEDGGLVVWLAAQSPHQARALLAESLRLPEARLRVICPDVGGSFGAKNRFYAEYVVVAAAALRLTRPVAWFGDRFEELVSGYQERDQIHDWSLGLDAEGRILALSGRFLSDNGAYDSGHSVVVPLTTAITIPGPYRIPHYAVEVVAVYTNKPPLAPYRGAGRQQGIFAMERLLDAAARELHLDPAEIRARNLIPPEALPYDVGLVRRDGQGHVVYDSGDYPAMLRTALDRAGYKQMRRDHLRLRRDGVYRGVGLACYVESAGVGATDRVHLRVEPAAVVLEVGTASQGQGHETTWAQVCAQRLGVTVEQVRVVQGDTASPAFSPGTFASRSAVAVGNAVADAARRAKAEVLHLAARLLETTDDALDLVKGQIIRRDRRGRGVPLADVVASAGPVEVSGQFTVSALAYGCGVHVAEIEVDPETGAVRVLRYLVVHDSGRELNPRIVEGQIIGGVAQGLGSALLEAVRFDESGQPLTASLGDYALPLATAVPAVDVIAMPHPSPTNPEGVKGVGEGGAIPVPAAIVAAVEDALTPFGVTFSEIPLTPEVIVRAIGRGRQGPGA